MSFHQSVATASRPGGQVKTGGLAVQRKCACGTHAKSGECEECRKKRVGLQHSDRSQPHPGARIAGIGRGQGAGSPGLAGDFNGVAAGSRVLPALGTSVRVQRQPLTEAAPIPAEAPAAAAPATPTVESAPEPASTVSPEAAPESVAAGQPSTLIADDSAAELQPGQLRKTEFLDQLHRAVCAEAEAALAGTGRSTDGCPYLANWFDYYRGQSSAHIEAALHRYAPESRSATTAAEYIPLVAARVRQGVERWASTGEITGVPEGVPGILPGMSGLLGAASAPASGLAGMFFKARDGGARPAEDPAAVQQALGSGRPLQSAVRSRMERAFGQSFAQVRTHTDSTAHRLSNDQNARAFTVGDHVAFGAGEYTPGTLVGDALVAHELAHVVQQGGAGAAVAPMEMGGAGYNELEEDADEAAAGAVSSLWGGGKGTLANLAKNAIPQLRSGLSIQRCSHEEKKAETLPELASYCDDSKCLKRSGCKAEDCKAEAKVVTDSYVKRVASIRRPDMPNQGDIHWGWMCYQWAGLLMREFEKLSLKCWQIRWVGIVSSSGALDHNYVFTSLGPAASNKGPVRDCGAILDPWRTGNPVVYGGEWDWHKWNYIHDTKDDSGKVYQNGKWNDVTYPPPWTPAEPAPSGP